MFGNLGRSSLRSLAGRNVGHNTRSATDLAFKTISVKQPSPFVCHVELNRPDKYNAFNSALWTELQECFKQLNQSPDCRAVVLSAAGKHFTAGLDLQDALKLGQELAEIEEVSRKGHFLAKKIVHCQNAITSLELCLKPVIVGIHSACVGAGVDLITAADIRYCTDDAWFQVKEVDIGMAADVGTLQRLPKVIGNQSLVRELCLTGRKFDSKEAFAAGLVSKTFSNREDLISECIKLAEIIASKSPIAVQGTKQNLIYSLEHTNQEGLEQIKEINKLNLQSEDFVTGVMAQASKGDPPVFAKL